VRVCRFLPGLLGLAIGWFCWALPASAIVFDYEGKKKVVGYVIADDGKRKTITTIRPGGERLDYPYTKEKMTPIYSELNEELLKGLTSRNPRGYWDYAEVLAKQAREHNDPEARETAMRLYLIAATLDKEKYGPKALLKLGTLIDNPTEARRCQALAFLLDPKGDAAEFFKQETAKPATLDRSPALQDFVRALQLYRAGQMDSAIEMAKHEGVDKIFIASGIIELKVFLQWCANPADSRPNHALRLVLQAELWAMNPRHAGEDADPKEATDPNSWSVILQSRETGRVAPLNPDAFKVGDIDPRKCHRQDFKWVEE
jgi:hypothetical protein